MTPTEIRLAFLANGYTPLPSVGKQCFLKAWPTLEVTPELVQQWERKHKRFADTGIRVQDGLAVIDIDINDQIIDEVAHALEEKEPSLSRALIRYGKGFKEAWFVRCDEPFGRIHTRRWLAPGADLDKDGTHVVEIFGGASPRFFGSAGAHTREPDGSIAVAYEWADGQSPLTVPLAELPEFTKAQLFAVVDTSERIMEAKGWTAVAKTQKGESEATRVWDLTEDMLFETNQGEVDVPFAALRARAGEEGLRVSASFIEPGRGHSLTRCLVGRTHDGDISIWDGANDTTHHAADKAPPKPLDADAAIDTAAMAEKLKRLAEHESERKNLRRTELQADDTLVQAASKLLQRYALCPVLTTPVVPIWTDDVTSGLTMANFRLMVAPWSEAAVGAQGQPLKTRISPADLWVNSEQRVTVTGLRMRPDMPRPTFKERNETFVNVYRPAVHPLSGGDAWGGIALLEQIIPDPAERLWLRQWTAYKYMNPGVPGPAVLMVARDAFGTGRSTWGDLLKLIFGARYVNTISFDHFAGRTTQSQFTEWQADSLIVLVNESSTADNGSNYRTKHDTYERLKEIVDPRAQERLILGKYIKAYRAQVCASYCIFTNNPDALPLPAGDRRFAVLTNGEPRDVAFWEGINEWMRGADNIGAFVRWLEATDLSGYSPFAPPPLTEAKASMTELSRSDLDRALADALDMLPGQVFTPEHVMSAMNHAKHVNGYDFPADKAEPLMRKIIQRAMHRVGVRQGQNWWFSHEGKRLAVYARTGRDAKLWTVAAQEDLRREILRNGAPGSAVSKLGEAVLRIAVDNTKE